MIVVRRPLRAVQYQGEGGSYLNFHAVDVHLTARFNDGGRAHQTISASEKLRMTFCLPVFGKWNGYRADDEAL
jgi:hypothetical protein